MRTGIRQRLEKLEREKMLDIGKFIAEMIRAMDSGKTDLLRGRKLNITREQVQALAEMTARLREVENGRDASDS
jgi:hypothetical protein